MLKILKSLLLTRKSCGRYAAKNKKKNKLGIANSSYAEVNTFNKNIYEYNILF